MPPKQAIELEKLKTYSQDPELANFDVKNETNQLLEPISKIFELFQNDTSGKFMGELSADLEQKFSTALTAFEQQFSELQTNLATALQQELSENDQRTLSKFTDRTNEILQTVRGMKAEITPKAGSEFPTYQELFEYIESVVPDLDALAVSAINTLESFDGDEKLDAKALKNIEDAIDIEKLKLPSYDDSEITKQIDGLRSAIQNIQSMPQRIIERGGGTGLHTVSDGTTKVQGISKMRFVNATVTKTNDEAVVAVEGGGGGTGDMEKSTYDTDDNGTVDDSEALEGNDSAYHLARTNHTGTQAISTVTGLQTALDAKEATANKGVANGYAELDANGTVPSAQLPSFVDDVIEVADFASLPASGETGKIYVTLNDNITYRWSGSAYVEISSSLALGETDSTAYRGDRGKIAYDHSQVTSGNPHNVTPSDVGLGNVNNTSDVDKPVSTAQQTALDLKSAKAGDTYTGVHDFGSAESVEIPNSAAPTVNADGEVAIDTSITDLSHGVMRFFAGEELFNLALPTAQLSALINGYVPAYNATTDEFELVAQASGSGDTITTTINTIKKDSTGGTSDTYGVLAGAVNGVNTTYTVSAGVYVSGSLAVYKNGVRLIQGSSEDWVETTPASGTFDFNNAPLSGDVIDVEYVESENTSSSLVVEKTTITISSNTTGTSSERNVLGNAASSDVTYTLPATSDIDSIGVRIKKIDNSGNSLILATPGAETIDGDTTYSLTTPDEDICVVSDGTNYYLLSN